MSEDEQEADRKEIARLDEAVRQVAARIPFPVALEADMGGTWILQIELGRRGGVDDPPDRATIDAGAGAVWWFETEQGAESSESTFGIDADPADVAAWITREARNAGSPAAANGIASMGAVGPPRTSGTQTVAHHARVGAREEAAADLSR